MADAARLVVTVRLFVGDEGVLGPGRADILEAIAREGSISAAGRSLGMSYKFAWDLVTSMNGHFADRLVETSAGGPRGGGAKLTTLGEWVLGAYRELERQSVRSAEGAASASLLGSLRRPREPSH